MVTIEILKQSQRTRPRKWVRNYGIFFFIVMLVFAILLGGRLLPSFPIATWLNQYKVTFLGYTYWMYDFLCYLVLPIALWVVGFFPLILAAKMGKYRRPYLILFVPAMVIHILYLIAMVYGFLHTYVPAISQFVDKYVPLWITNLVATITIYVGIGLAVWYTIICFFAMIYNKNYPAKYEDIYAHRKARLKSIRNLDERVAYKQRFYDDYREGNWDSMMIDLHYNSIYNESNDPIPDDAYEFLKYMNGKNETTIKSAILDQYRSEGRNSEIRAIYQKTELKEDRITRGGAVIALPPKDPLPPPKPKIKAVPVQAPPPPPPYVPPLKSYIPRKKRNVNVKTWSPDDI